MAYYFYYGLFWLISLIPLKVLYLLADLVQPIVKRKYRWKVVNDNLAKSFPEKSEAEREKIADDFYHMLCDYMVEDIKLFSMSKKKMMKRMTFSGLEHIKEGFDSGKDYMFAYLGHFGNWEWIASLQYWMPYAHFSHIYHPIYNKVSYRIFLKLREQYGGECIPMKKTLRRILEIKRNGENVVVGLISDQQPKWESIHHFTPFLNRETAVFTGTEVLAKKLGAMVYYAHVTRPRRGYYHCEFVPMTHTPAEHPDFDLTDQYMKMLEKDICTTPHMWLWTHKRWRRTKEEWLKRQKSN